MRGRLDWLDTGAGHILVALFIFLVGVGMIVARIDLGKEVVIGALASLWTRLRMNQRGTKD